MTELSWQDITKFKDGGVKKKILRSGKGPKPTEFAECEIQYIGYFTSGKVFANTYREYEKSVTFVLKKGKVIFGWELAAMSMKKGEKARFKISSAYAYGANGLPPNIPPDTNLVFDIELVEWKSLRNRKDKFMEKTSQSYEELVRGAEKEKEEGNALFQAEEYHAAIERYQEAVQYARFVYEPKLRHTTRPIMLACELNKAFCHLKLKQWREAIKACDEALKLDGHEPKAFFRKAVAFRMMGQDAEAKKNILQAKRLCADDPGIDREMTLIEWQWEQRRKREKKVFEGLFDEEAMRRVEEMSETPEAALSHAHPLRFKEDERLKRTDHVSLPGEDDALSKWGGAITDALPKGDFKIRVEEEEAQKEADAKEKRDESGDDGMPGLEPVAAEKMKPVAAAPVEKKPAAAAAVKATPKPVVSASPAPKPVAVVKPAPAAVTPAPAVAGASDYVYDNSVTNASNPQIYMNFSVGGEPAGKVIVELFADRVPKSAALFRKLCEKGYAGTVMSRFVHNYILQGGELGHAAFTNERLDIPLDQEGLLCLAAPGSSQFFFTLVDCSHLNGQFVVIGKVLDGIEVLLDDLASVAVDENDVPRKKIAIRSAGDFDSEL